MDTNQALSIKKSGWLLLVGYLVALLVSSCSRTQVSQHEVTLRDGRKLSAHDTVTRGPDGWFRTGRGPVTKTVLSFQANGEEVTWARTPGQSNFSYPVALDFIDHAPVLVMAVRGFEGCREYGFPAEGMAAFRYAHGAWSRIPSGQLPGDLRANFREDWPRKRPLLQDVIEREQKSEEACIKIRPPPDPERDAVRVRVAQAEAEAKTVIATLIESDDSPEEITPQEFRRQRGTWAGGGYLAESCEKIVDGLDPVMEWYGNGNKRRVGIQISFPAGTTVQIPDRRGDLQGAICDADTVYVVKRIDARVLNVFRFTRQGALIDDVKIQMEEATQAGRWLILWQAQSEGGGQLLIRLGNYDEHTLSNRRTYRVTLP